MYSCPICEKKPPTASLSSCRKRMARALKETGRGARQRDPGIGAKIIAKKAGITLACGSGTSTPKSIATWHNTREVLREYFQLGKKKITEAPFQIKEPWHYLLRTLFCFFCYSGRTPGALTVFRTFALKNKPEKHFLSGESRARNPSRVNKVKSL